jgi:Xaa-Pro aminopeptidase
MKKMKKLGIKEKVCNAIENSEYDAIVAVGSDNVLYLSGASMPFLYSYPDRPVIVIWPKNGIRICICPVEWESTLRNMSWLEKVSPYTEGEDSIKPASKTLAEELKGLVDNGGKIGLDLNRVSNALFNNIENALSGLEIVDCSDWIKTLRMTKTSEEAELLEDVAYRTDHGIVGSAHHIIVTHPKTEMALAEDTRVHCMERGLDTVGHHSMAQAASGISAKKMWPLVDRYAIGWEKVLQNGELVRLGMVSSYDGYWSDATRTVINGEPTAEQSKTFNDLISLRKKAMDTIKPGVKCSKVYNSVLEKAGNDGIKLLNGLGVGHGIGVTSHEAPYLTATDDTALKPGMILVLDPVISGPDGEIWRSKDTVIVTDTGCKTLGWYINWRAPYIAAYNL